MAIKIPHPFEPAAEVLAWIFTFGLGHRHPLTGAPLEHRFLVLRGPFEEARAEMVRRFGTKWAGQYSSPSEAGVGRFELRELEGSEALGLAEGS